MYWEIVELEDGEVALCQVDEENEPLVTIRFSDEAKSKLQDRHLEIARAMFSAGMHIASHLNTIPEDSDDIEEHTVH